MVMGLLRPEPQMPQQHLNQLGLQVKPQMPQQHLNQLGLQVNL
jgi:hypothetical protein